MARSPRGLHVRVLGPLEILVDGQPMVTDTRKASAILALLVVEQRAFARDELAAMFWPESDDEAARGSLRRTLSSLRSGLTGRWLIVDRARVALDTTSATVDLHALTRLADADDLPSLAAGAELVRGPFLAGFNLRDSPAFDDWRAIRASAAEALSRGVLERHAAALEATGEVPAALRATRRLLELDPLDEAAHRRAIALHAAAGDRTAAIRQYRDLVAILERELGVAPLSETTALYESLRETPTGGSRPSRVAPAVPLASPRGGAGVALAAGPTDPAAHQLAFVGRDAELARILEAHRDAVSGGRVVGIDGEPGIGKTRLAREVGERVRERGGLVLAAAAYASETGIAYAPLSDLLRQGLRSEAGAGRLRDLAPDALAVLGRLVELPPVLARMATGGTPPPDPALARGLLIEAIAAALTRLVDGRQPGAVVVDDLHWADASTLELLGYMVRRMAERRFMLVLTWRSDDLGEAATRLARQVDETPGSVGIRLQRLPPETVVQLVRLSVHPATGDVPTAMVDALVNAAEGLPLYLAERLAEPPSGHPGSPPPGPPRGFRALLRERLGRVSETAAQVLSAGAVIGRSFDLATVRAAAGRTEDETVAALEELLRRGLLRESDAAGELRFDFAHGSLLDAAYEATSLVRRRILHRRVADALRAGGDRTQGAGTLERMAQIARHEEAAGRTAEAAEAYGQAAIAARAVHANHEAGELLAAAHALGHPDPAWVQRQLGEVRFAQGDYAQASTSLEAAASISGPRDLGEIELLLGRVHARRGDATAAISHLEAALTAAGEDAGRLRARILVERSVVALRLGDLATARDSAEGALRWAEQAGDTAAAGLVHRVRGLIARAEGNLPEASAELERSLAAADADPDPAARIAAANALALVRAALRDGEGAIKLLEVARDEARRVGMRHLEAAIENNLADRFHQLGRHDLSQEHLRRAVGLFAEVGGSPGELEPEIWKLETW